MAIQGAKTYPANAAMDRVRKISCGAYATLDRASEANTGSAMRFGSNVWDSLSLRKGRPTRRRLAAPVSLDTDGSLRPADGNPGTMPPGQWPADRCAATGRERSSRLSTVPFPGTAARRVCRRHNRRGHHRPGDQRSVRMIEERGGTSEVHIVI